MLTDEKYMQFTAELQLRGLINIAEDGSSIGLSERGIEKAKELLSRIEMPDRLLA